MHLQQRQQFRAHDVHPQSFLLGSPRRFVDPDHRGRPQPCGDSDKERGEHLGGFGQPIVQRPHRHRRPEHVRQRFCAAFVGDVLTDQKVDGVRLDVRAVTRWSGRLPWEHRCRLAPARTFAALGTMLDDHHHRFGNVEHLPHRLGNHDSVVESRTAPPAFGWGVNNNLIGFFYRVQRHPRSAALFALRPFRFTLTSLAAIRDRSFVLRGVAVRRRRPRRVRRITTEQTFKDRDLRHQHFHSCQQQRDLLRLRGDDQVLFLNPGTQHHVLRFKLRHTGQKNSIRHPQAVYEHPRDPVDTRPTTPQTPHPRPEWSR